MICKMQNKAGEFLYLIIINSRIFFIGLKVYKKSHKAFSGVAI